MYTREGQVVCEEVGEEKRGAQCGVGRRSDHNAIAADVEIDPLRRRLGRSRPTLLFRP